MRLKDIYDSMPDGAAQRRRNKQRLDELTRDDELRRARIAQVVSYADLSGRLVMQTSPYTL